MAAKCSSTPSAGSKITRGKARNTPGGGSPIFRVRGRPLAPAKPPKDEQRLWNATRATPERLGGRPTLTFWARQRLFGLSAQLRRCRERWGNGGLAVRALRSSTYHSLQSAFVPSPSSPAHCHRLLHKSWPIPPSCPHTGPRRFPYRTTGGRPSAADRFQSIKCPQMRRSQRLAST